VRYRRALAKGVAYLQTLPIEDEWRYTGRQPGDAHTMGWALVALGVAGLGGVGCDEKVLERTGWQVDRLTEPIFGTVCYELGRGSIAAYGSKPGISGDSPARGTRGELTLDRDRFWGWNLGLTGLTVWGRLLHARRVRRDELVRKGIASCTSGAPEWDEKARNVDMCGWMYGAGLLAVGNKSPRVETVKWFRALHEQILPHQHTEGALAGSWDPVDLWGHAGGRIYATAALARALEAPYLYDYEVVGPKNAPKAFATAYKALQKTAKKDASDEVRARASEIVERLDERWKY
jgi:hypothetical protein